jgi:hypothetical protein
VKPVDFRFLVESGEESVDVDAGHDDLRDQELNVQLKLKETLLWFNRENDLNLLCFGFSFNIIFSPYPFKLQPFSSESFCVRHVVENPTNIMPFNN